MSGARRARRVTGRTDRCIALLYGFLSLGVTTTLPRHARSLFRCLERYTVLPEARTGKETDALLLRASSDQPWRGNARAAPQSDALEIRQHFRRRPYND